MRTKLIPLVFSVIFAVLATSLVLFCPNSHIIKGNIDSAVSPTIVNLNAEPIQEPQGLPIDDPIMPG